MSNKTVTDILFFTQYPLMAIIWYWFFVDAVWINLTAGILILLYSLLHILSPRLLPNRPNIFGATAPDRIGNIGKRFMSAAGIAAGALMITGHRIENARTMGIVGLFFFGAISILYLYWIISSDSAERSEAKKIWIFSFIGLVLFIALSIFILSRGSDEIMLFRKLSPYPMMIFFLVIGIWHFLVIRRKRK